MSDIDWKTLNAKLPYERTESAQDKRKKLFKEFDVNRNGYISLAETDAGMRTHLGEELHFDGKRAIQEAFHYAKNKSTDYSKYGDDFLEFREFRLFLQTLRQYFEYYEIFKKIDTSDDDKISRDEFLSEDVRDALERWTDPDKRDALQNMEAEFDAIDVNGGGSILLREFLKWAVDKNLDLEDEPDLLSDDNDYDGGRAGGKSAGKRAKSAKDAAGDDDGNAAKGKEKKSGMCSIL